MAWTPGGGGTAAGSALVEVPGRGDERSVFSFAQKALWGPAVALVVVVVVVADIQIQEFIFRVELTGLTDCPQGVLTDYLHHM